MQLHRCQRGTNQWWMGLLVAVPGEFPCPSLGRSDDRPWGVLLAAYGEFRVAVVRVVLLFCHDSNFPKVWSLQESHDNSIGLSRAVASPAARQPGPLVTFVRWRTVAKVDSIGVVVLRWT